MAKYLEVVGGLQRAGVRLMTGSDFGANPLLFPGWGVHDELELLVRAGLKPEEALVAATRHPAEFLGFGDRLGTIAPGKLADLILLEADPLADIRNTRRSPPCSTAGGCWIRRRGRRSSTRPAPRPRPRASEASSAPFVSWVGRGRAPAYRACPRLAAVPPVRANLPPTRRRPGMGDGRGL